MSNTMLMMSAALAGEVVLLVLVLLTVAYLRGRAQKNRDRKAVATLFARIKNGKVEREKTIVQFLEQDLGLSGDGLQKARVAIMRGEMGLLQRIAGIYQTRDAAALARADDDLYAAVEPYHALGPVDAGRVSDESDGETPVDGGEFGALRAENKRLSEELTITMETMSRMLNEYSTMFAGVESDDVAPIGAVVAASAGAAADDDVVIDSGFEGDEVAASGDDAPDDDDGAIEIASSTADEVQDASDDEALDGGFEAGKPAVVDDHEADVDVVASDDEHAEVQDSAEEVGETVIAPDAPDAPDAAEITEVDEIAAIVREAQAQEQSARGGEGGEAVDASAFEEGPSEIIGRDGADDEDVISADEIDDLFDAAIVEEEAGHDGSVGTTKPADEALKSQTGG